MVNQCKYFKKGQCQCMTTGDKTCPYIPAKRETDCPAFWRKQ